MNFSLFDAFINYRELTWNLVVRNLKVRYKNSFLGFFWTLLNPIMQILIYYFFIRLMRFEMDLADLLSGIIPWHFLAMTMGDSVDAISGNATLITKVRFPRIILILATCLANLINYLLSLLVLIAWLPLLGASLSLKTFLIFPLAFVSFLLVFGLSLIVSTSNVYFKDTAHLLGVTLQAWFFMTPIIYPFKIIPSAFRDLVFLNPMAGIITVFRGVLLEQPFPSLYGWLTSSTIVLLCLYTGIRLFQHFEPIFSDEL